MTIRAQSPTPASAPTLGQALARLVRDPRRSLLARWNWKSAVTSSLVRGAIFFAVNATAGWNAAWSAFLTELAYRAATAGFYGTLTQTFSEVRPRRHGMWAALVLLPFANHSIEFLAHWARGTERLGASILASVCFTIVSTAFHVFVMRRGLLTVGGGSQGLLADLRQMPRAVALFVAAPFVAALQVWQRVR